MDSQERQIISNKVVEIIENMQSGPGGLEEWVNLANLGVPLTAAGIQYKALGYAKLRPFLNEFRDALEFRDIQTAGNPAVCYVRPIRSREQPSMPFDIPETPDREAAEEGKRGERVPTKDSWLFTWASIPSSQIRTLADLALDEKWYYADSPVQERETFPILRNYLAYTFKRLCFEGKVKIQSVPARNEEYAAFNTGLVDKKYEYIYALFKQNTRYPSPYWYLLAFVVAGEDMGKTLVSLFNPLPQKADYFENRIENMLYDTSTGALSCDYTHILTERTGRLPLNFLKENCPEDFLSIDGVSIDEVYGLSPSEEKRDYFQKLGEKIRTNNRIFNRLKNRIEDAVDLALKRVEWNYKTAIPMYYPAKNNGSLLLPLALEDEDHVDLALVVERQLSGSYQGQTILPLNLAYTNSRLVTRPDSDWLKTDMIKAEGSDSTDEEE